MTIISCDHCKKNSEQLDNSFVGEYHLKLVVKEGIVPKEILSRIDLCESCLKSFQKKLIDLCLEMAE